jgi:biopolymer transport protein ExbB
MAISTLISSVITGALEPATQVKTIETTQTVWEFLTSGGYIMIPLGICSIVVLALTMDRWMRITPNCVLPKGIDGAMDLLEQGRFQEALTAGRDLNAPAGRILAAGIQRRDYDLEHIERAMEDQGQREVEKLKTNIRPLSLIASIAPLLGLLGTVMGIQNSFALVVKSGMGKPENFAGGIEEALVTTIAGLCVAIPALLIASHFNSKVRRLMIETDERLTPALDFLTRPKEWDGEELVALTPESDPKA